MVGVWSQTVSVFVVLSKMKATALGQNADSVPACAQLIDKPQTLLESGIAVKHSKSALCNHAGP